MERRMPEAHDAIRVASEKPGFVFSVTRLEFPAYKRERIRGGPNPWRALSTAKTSAGQDKRRIESASN
jgi:hypothetical protein